MNVGEGTRLVAAASAAIDDKTRIVRLRGASDTYLDEEELWRDHEALVDALVGHTGRLDRRPDILHAHLADAGRLAATVGARLGIPCLFTAHSLGRPKRVAIGDRMEAIAGAAGIVASSRDEAERQHADYDAYEPGRIRIIAPAATSTPSPHRRDGRKSKRTSRVSYAIRQNRDPRHSPAGAEEELRRVDPPPTAARPRCANAPNLALVAGTRDRLETLEPEHPGTLREILDLVDRCDL